MREEDEERKEKDPFRYFVQGPPSSLLYATANIFRSRSSTWQMSQIAISDR